MESSGQGIGSQILARCVAAVPEATTELWTKVHDDDPDALAVAQHWGFEVVQRSISSRVDLAGATSPQPPPGVTLEDCDRLEFEGEDAVAFDAMLAASQTNPEAESSHRFTREEMQHWTDPGETPVACLARVDGRPAALVYGIVIVRSGEGLGEGPGEGLGEGPGESPARWPARAGSPTPGSTRPSAAGASDGS